MTIILGLCFAFGIGTSDYHGGYVTKRSQALAAVASAFIAGIVTSAALLVFVVDSELVAVDVGLGVASGCLIGFALAAMYHGMSVASAAVVAPVSVFLASTIPFGWALRTGGELASLAVVGAVVAFVGLLLSTVSPDLGDRAVVGVKWGLVAGEGFGASLALLGETGPASGLWPTLAQRLTAFIALALAATARGLPVVVPVELRRRAALSGALGACGIAAFTVGAQRGSLAELAAVSALSPAVTAILSAVFDGHPMRWWQTVGVGVCVLGIALIGAA